MSLLGIATYFIWLLHSLETLFLFCTWQVIDKSFGFDTAVEEAQRAINAAHVEAESIENGIGLVKLMGRYSGKFLFWSLFEVLILHCNKWESYNFSKWWHLT